MNGSFDPCNDARSASKQELTALGPDVNAAVARGVVVRVISFGEPPPLHAQVVAYLGDRGSDPTGCLLLTADQSQVFMATYPPNTVAIAHWLENPTLALLASGFINIEYYFLRMSNDYPAELRQLLLQVVEPEDVARYAFHFDFLEQRWSNPSS